MSNFASRARSAYTCGCYSGGPVERVDSHPLSADADDLTPHMQQTAYDWLFSGFLCKGCGRRYNGTYLAVENTEPVTA
jgi:hypothetical protein